MHVRFFNYPLQFTEYEVEFMAIIKDTLSSGRFILGPDLDSFEKNLAAYVGAEYAVGVGNGTDAILLSLCAIGIKEGDEIITVSHTFVATIEAMIFLGAKPVFVDIGDDHNMDVNLVEDAITSKTKAVVPVQLNGRVCSNMHLLMETANAHGLHIIEDAAQGLGAKYQGKDAGTFGEAGTYSFYPAKTLGAFGDAGAIVTDSSDLAYKLRLLRNHGRGMHGDIELWGLNSRMDNIQAAILNYRLSHLDRMISKRREIAAMYDRGFSGIEEIVLPPSPSDNSDHFDTYQNYEMEVAQRDELFAFLNERGIEAAKQWGGKGVHQFNSLGLDRTSLPRTEKFFERGIMLPLHPGLKDHHVEYVIETIRHFYKR